MKLTDKIKLRISELKEKELNEPLLKDETIELGKLYISQEIIEKYSGPNEIKHIAVEELTDFDSIGIEIISISWDYTKTIHIIYYREI